MIFKKFSQCLIITGLFIFYGQTLLFGQSNLKEGNNNFALFTRSGEFKNLESAKKFADEAYKTPRDSTGYKNNLLRALVYSSLSVADSNRKLKYKNDPLEDATLALSLLKDDNLNYENESQIIYIHRKLAHGYQIIAARELAKNNYQLAFDNFILVDKFSNGELQVKKNLAILSELLNKNELAVFYYKEFLLSQKELKPQNFLNMSRLYLEIDDFNDAINILLTGLDQYPKNKDILFDIINIYADNGLYDSLIPYAELAIEIDPQNIELNYLAGYANEVIGNKKLAELYYKKIITLDGNNYNGNYELGLLYLKEFIKSSKRNDQDFAKEYLLKANEINPNAVNALKALAVLFKKNGDSFQYERVQNQLNRDIIN